MVPMLRALSRMHVWGVLFFLGYLGGDELGMRCTQHVYSKANYSTRGITAFNLHDIAVIIKHAYHCVLAY